MANKESRAQQALQPRVPDPNLKLPSGPLTGPGAAAGPLVVSVANPRYSRLRPATPSTGRWST